MTGISSLFKNIAVVLSLLLAAMTGKTLQAGITTEERYIYYEVSGDTAAELRQSINSKTRHFKARFDAVTRWKIKWQFSYIPRQKKCKITEVIIDASIDYTLPQWSQSAEHPDHHLVQQWEQYSTQLLAHERRHGALVKAATLEVERKILTADDTAYAPPNCNKLQKLANKRAQKVIEKLEKQHQAFDLQTDHGRNTGATFP